MFSQVRLFFRIFQFLQHVFLKKTQKIFNDRLNNNIKPPTAEFEAIYWLHSLQPQLASNSPKTYLHTTSVFDSVVTGVTARQIAKKERRPESDKQPKELHAYTLEMPPHVIPLAPKCLFGPCKGSYAQMSITSCLIVLLMHTVQGRREGDSSGFRNPLEIFSIELAICKSICIAISHQYCTTIKQRANIFIHSMP